MLLSKTLLFYQSNLKKKLFFQPKICSTLSTGTEARPCHLSAGHSLKELLMFAQKLSEDVKMITYQSQYLLTSFIIKKELILLSIYGLLK